MIAYPICIPGILLAGDAYLAFSLEQEWRTVGILAVFVLYYLLFARGLRRVGRSNFSSSDERRMPSVSWTIKLMQFVTLVGAFVSVFSPMLVIGALTLESAYRMTVYSQSWSQFAYFSSVAICILFGNHSAWVDALLSEAFVGGSILSLSVPLFIGALVFGFLAVSIYIARKIAADIRVIALS